MKSKLNLYYNWNNTGNSPSIESQSKVKKRVIIPAAETATTASRKKKNGLQELT